MTAKRLRDLGFTNAVNVKGSIFAWANEGRLMVNTSGPTDQVDPFDADWGHLLDPSHRASDTSPAAQPLSRNTP